jgi:hypothetical protein
MLFRQPLPDHGQDLQEEEAIAASPLKIIFSDSTVSLLQLLLSETCRFASKSYFYYSS